MTFAQAVDIFRRDYSKWQREWQPTAEFMKEYQEGAMREIEYARAALRLRDGIPKLYRLITGEHAFVESLGQLIGDKEPFRLPYILTGDLEREYKSTVTKYFSNFNDLGYLCRVADFDRGGRSENFRHNNELRDQYEFYKAVSCLFDTLFNIR